MKIINIENFNTFKEFFEDNDIDYIIINITFLGVSHVII